MSISEFLEDKLRDRQRILANIKRLQADLAVAEKRKHEAAEQWRDEETHYQKQRHEEARFKANAAYRELREVADKELPKMERALAEIDAELPGLHHRAETEMQAASVELFFQCVQSLARWFDLGFQLVQRLDRIRDAAAERWPVTVQCDGLPALPRHAGLPPAAEVLVPVFGAGDRPGVSSEFKRVVGEWRLDALDPADPARLEIEHRREVEAEGERQTAARIAEMRQQHSRAVPGVTAASVAPPPRQSLFGKWFQSGDRPSVPPSGAITDDQQLEQARAQLGRAATAFIDIDSARSRGEATLEEADQARVQLDRAKAEFARIEAQAITRV
jgi:hypothetical protein